MLVVAGGLRGHCPCLQHLPGPRDGELDVLERCLGMLLARGCPLPVPTGMCHTPPLLVHCQKDTRRQHSSSQEPWVWGLLVGEVGSRWPPFAASLCRAELILQSAQAGIAP